MKQKHIDIRIKQCLELANASNCPRRKFGALLLDPERNVVLMDGYNGGPRGGAGDLCKGHWCSRNGFPADEVNLVESVVHKYQQFGGSRTTPCIRVLFGSHELKVFTQQPLEKLTEPGTMGPFDFSDAKSTGTPFDDLVGQKMGAQPIPSTMDRAKAWVEEMQKRFPPIRSGTQMEHGCHHAEFNVISNAAASGVPCKGAWLIVTGEPCLMCAKLLHHAGVAKVIIIDGGYAGGTEGVEYLEEHGVQVQAVEGPKDPRLVSE
jgi:deoxycytidylate deaminase